MKLSLIQLLILFGFDIGKLSHINFDFVVSLFVLVLFARSERECLRGDEIAPYAI